MLLGAEFTNGFNNTKGVTPPTILTQMSSFLEIL